MILKYKINQNTQATNTPPWCINNVNVQLKCTQIDICTKSTNIPSHQTQPSRTHTCIQTNLQSQLNTKQLNNHPSHQQNSFNPNLDPNSNTKVKHKSNQNTRLPSTTIASTTNHTIASPTTTPPKHQPEARLNVLPLMGSLTGGDNQLMKELTMGTCLSTPCGMVCDAGV